MKIHPSEHNLLQHLLVCKLITNLHFFHAKKIHLTKNR